MLHGCRLGLRQDFSEVDERRCRDSWWWSPQLLGGEAKERCTVKLGKRAVRSHHVGHEIFGDPELVDGSWVQLQVEAPRSQRCVKARWSEGTLVARSSSGWEIGA